MRTIWHVLTVSALVTLVACGGSDSGGTGPSPTPTPSTFTLTGTVSDQATGQGITGATVTILDGANAGKSTTTSGGSFSLTGLQPSGFTIRARAQYYDEASVGVTVTSNTSTSMTLRPLPLFTRTGGGNSVFDMPTYVRRVRIFGRWNNKGTSNFIVRIGADFVVNAILRNGNPYEGTHVTTGGVTEIRSSENITEWSFTEVR